VHSGDFIEISGKIKEFEWCGSPPKFFAAIDSGIIKVEVKGEKILQSMIQETSRDDIILSPQLHCRE
jgi:hypothetical protein